ncbi:MAG: hypothetical protein GY794_08560 [bacterium]|nr:hypothetical protein [bacterium]
MAMGILAHGTLVAMALLIAVLPPFLFGFLTLKYMAYRSLPWLRKGVFGRWVLPVVAGVTMLCLILLVRCVLDEIPYLIWWLVFLLSNIILLFAWIKAAIGYRITRKRSGRVQDVPDRIKSQE